MRMKDGTERNNDNQTNYLQNLDEKTILLALAGNPEALMEVVDAYELYINRLAEREVQLGNDRVVRRTDETVKCILKTGLMMGLIQFDPYR